MLEPLLSSEGGGAGAVGGIDSVFIMFAGVSEEIAP